MKKGLYLCERGVSDGRAEGRRFGCGFGHWCHGGVFVDLGAIGVSPATSALHHKNASLRAKHWGCWLERSGHYSMDWTDTRLDSTWNPKHEDKKPWPVSRWSAAEVGQGRLVPPEGETYLPTKPIPAWAMTNNGPMPLPRWDMDASQARIPGNMGGELRSEAALCRLEMP